MNRDELCVALIEDKLVIVDALNGLVYRTRGPGGVPLIKPELCPGSKVNGYLTANLTARGEKKQIRLHRLIWIYVNGVPPADKIVDHRDSNKGNNRISNLQLLTPESNSSKAARDGLYKPNYKIRPEQRAILIADYQTGVFTHQALATKYGVSKHLVSKLVTNWRKGIA